MTTTAENSDPPRRHVARGGSRIDSIQIFRGLAALGVVLYHIKLQFTVFVPGSPDMASNPVPWLMHRMGFLGVDFFFVLSGFIIYYIHRNDLGKPRKGGVFLAKRFVRIQPLLWVIILVKQAYLTLVANEVVDWPAVANTALTLPGKKIIGVSWTLTFEWMFYGFFLACILAGARWLWVGAGVWAASVLVLGHLDQDAWNSWFQCLGSPYVIQFLCGVVAAEAYRRWPQSGGRRDLGWVALAAGLTAAGALMAPLNLALRDWETPTDMAYGRFFWGPVFGLIVWLAARNDGMVRGRWCLPLVVLGNASYAIYLFHNELLQVLIRVGHSLKIFEHGSAVLWMWVFTFVLLAITIVVHFVIERPLLALGRRWVVNRLKPAKAKAASESS